MRYGFVVPSASPREFAELAALGERRGWDGVFTWEALWHGQAWVTLGAAAMVTEKVKLGTLLTPASRWRPWDLASSVLTVDQLSNGRAVMSVGLGAPNENWTAFEPDEGRRLRAEKLDECLAIYDGLMRGQPFAYEGTHYSAKPTEYLLPDPPAQRPGQPPGRHGGSKAGGAGRSARTCRRSAAASRRGRRTGTDDQQRRRNVTGPGTVP